MVQNVMFIKRMKIIRIWNVFQLEKKSKILFGTSMIAFCMGFTIADITDGAWKAL